MTKTLVATEIKTVIGTLRTVAGIAAKFNITEETIRDMVQSGFMPHYRVEGFEDPLFKAEEARQWIADNLIKKYGGTELPQPQIVVVSDHETESARNVPSALAAVDGLREFRPELFCGVYFLCLGNAVVYVGRSTNVMVRALTHKQEKRFDRVLFLRLPISSLDETEKYFIKVLCPPLNVVHKPVDAAYAEVRA